MANLIMENYAELDKAIRLAVRSIDTTAYPSADQEDLIQDGWEAILKAQDTFDPDRGVKVSSWASTVVKNSFYGKTRQLNALKSRESVYDPEADVTPASGFTPEDVVVEEAVKAALRKIIANYEAKGLTKGLEARKRGCELFWREFTDPKGATDLELAKEYGVSRETIAQNRREAARMVKHILHDSLPFREKALALAV